MIKLVHLLVCGNKRDLGVDHPKAEENYCDEKKNAV
jgi:hypothetical protein